MKAGGFLYSTPVHCCVGGGGGAPCFAGGVPCSTPGVPTPGFFIRFEQLAFGVCQTWGFVSRALTSMCCTLQSLSLPSE